MERTTVFRPTFPLIFALVAGACTTQAGEEIRVGVYPGVGDAGIVEALDAVEGVHAGVLETYAPDLLGGFDCVVIPHGKNVSIRDEMRPWRSILRRYVELGGTVILTHQAVGSGGVFEGQELFGEIETAAGRKDAWSFRRAPGSTHPLARRLPAWIRHAYCDHITMYPGPLGQVICTDAEGDATVVAGSFGKGRVVAIGALLGWRSIVQELKHYDGEATAPQGGELSLLVEAVHWAGDGGTLDASKMERALKEAPEQAEGKPLVVFASNFESWRLSENEWIVPAGPTPESNT